MSNDEVVWDWTMSYYPSKSMNIGCLTINIDDAITFPGFFPCPDYTLAIEVELVSKGNKCLGSNEVELDWSIKHVVI